MKLKLTCLVVILALAGVTAEGRTRRARPELMPNDIAFTTASNSTKKSVRRTGASEYGAETEKESAGAGQMAFGAQVGFLGKTNSTSADALGLQMAWGLRLIARIPVWERFYIKPSLGYFRRSQGAGSSSLTENTFELGGTIQYALLRGSRVKLLVGLAQRLDAFTVKIDIASATTSSPLTFGYRLGPEVGVAFGLSRSISLVIDTDVTFGTRTHVGLAAGFLFFLPE